MMGGGAAAAPAAVAAGKATMDLDAVINKSQSFCLNEAAGHPMSNLFVGDDRLYLESGADEQLLLTINFKDTVNLEAISFVGPIDEAAPLTVKLFANGVNLSFENCEDLKPTQEFQLTPSDLTADSMTKLYAVKFQRLNSLTIFIEDNNGAEATKLSGLKLFGTTVIGTNMAEFKKVG